MGVLLVDFLRLFGRTLNNDDVGISCTHGGFFFNKLDAGKGQPMRPYMLCVEDPADADNDLSKGSYNFLKVTAMMAALARATQRGSSCPVPGAAALI